MRREKESAGYSTDPPETRRVFVRRSVQKPEFYGVRRTRSVLESSNATLHVHALDRACTVTSAEEVSGKPEKE